MRQDSDNFSFETEKDKEDGDQSILTKKIGDNHFSPVDKNYKGNSGLDNKEEVRILMNTYNGILDNAKPKEGETWAEDVAERKVKETDKNLRAFFSDLNNRLSLGITDNKSFLNSMKILSEGGNKVNKMRREIEVIPDNAKVEALSSDNPTDAAVNELNLEATKKRNGVFGKAIKNQIKKIDEEANISGIGQEKHEQGMDNQRKDSDQFEKEDSNDNYDSF